MDPNALLKNLNDVVESSYGLALDEINELCSDLSEWIAHGGFLPEWDRFPSATVTFEHWLAKKK